MSPIFIKSNKREKSKKSFGFTYSIDKSVISGMST